MPEEKLRVKRGYSAASDPGAAVAELKEAIDQPDAAIVVFFASSKYDLDHLGRELGAAFDVPLVGCTTAGELTPDGYREGTLTGVSLASSALRVDTELISNVRAFDADRTADVAGAVKQRMRAATEELPGAKSFGMILIDGLSVMEEQVIGSLSNALGTLPIVGGSAGDDIAFAQTHIYWNGAFRTDAACFTVFTTTHPFATGKTQHFVSTDAKMVITGADPARRIVHEINGEPAAWEYARLVGLEVDQLEPMIFSKYPVMLKIGGEYYVRSIQKVNDDESLTFYCAIDEGLVLTLSQGIDLVENLGSAFADSRKRVPEPELVLGFECILRRLEIQEKDLTGPAGDLMCSNKVIGFHTYGEQFDAVHVNQTFTFVALGK